MRAVNTGALSGVGFSDEYRDARLDDARLFGRYVCDGGAENIAVVESDVGDDAQDGLQDVRGIEPSSESRFHDGHFHPRLGEAVESHCGRHLEVGEPPFGHLLSVPVEKGGDLLLRYHLAVHANALPEIVQMGRGVESRPVPAACRTEASMWATEPLPLVPAMWMER